MKLQQDLEKFFIGWRDKPAHPDAPTGGGGTGHFRHAGSINTQPSTYSSIPHPDSPVGRRLNPQEIASAILNLFQTPTNPIFRVFQNPALAEFAAPQTEPAKTSTSTSDEKMSMSQNGVNLLKQIERLRLKPYDDQTGKEISAWVKGATIGYGHLIAKFEWEKYKNGISESDAQALFQKNFPPYEACVREHISVKLQQNQFDALVMLAYNIGKEKGGFPDSSVVKLINDPQATTNYKNLEQAWKAWNKSQGKVLQGLNNRRESEWNVYSKGVYKGW